MPYIKMEDRRALEEGIYFMGRYIGIRADDVNLPGLLNYVITRITLGAYQEKYGDPKYHHINEIIGILECAKQEMYRRVAGPYEDVASIKNGDIPEFEEWGD